MRVAIVGCGLIGKRRAMVVENTPGDELVLVVDVDSAAAKALAAEMGCASSTNWIDAVTSQADVVVVSTSNKFLAPIAIASLKSGKHVLCEKPMGRNLSEARDMARAAKSSGKLLKIGFNLRYHPAIYEAHRVCAAGEIGPLLYARAVYGHGGRLGYEKEWRGDPDLAGGGELLDQGVHILDLYNWFFGDFERVYGSAQTYFWDLGRFPRERQAGPLSGKQLEDNVFGVLHTAQGQTASFQTSWTQWKNAFVFEVFGRDGYVRVNGLGGSYGVQTLTVGKRKPEYGAPVEHSQEFPGPDNTWESEWVDFSQALRTKTQPLGNAEDGISAMRLVDALYRSARDGLPVKTR